jgi:hypothetical protein
MDANNRWHRGRPPSGWWQAEDRRWRPPPVQEPSGNQNEWPPPSADYPTRGPRPPRHATARHPVRRWLYVLLVLALIATVAVVVAATVADSS